MSTFASDYATSAYTVHATPEQMRRRKIVKKGFSLCLMVCGHSGTGKSTFINTLCGENVFKDRPRRTSEMELHDHTYQLDEADGTSIHLTVVDTPGFGDAIDNNSCCDRIVKYLERQFDEILIEEQRVRRNPRFKDNRVHAALYFIAPTGHGLRELDIDLMMSLSARVNVIPVIAKADTLTPEELAKNKAAIMHDIRHFNIPVYLFPCDSDDQETLYECDTLRSMVPFAIVGSNDYYRVESADDKRLIRAREYPWGIVTVEDPNQSDFAALRSVLFGSHLQELREITHDVLYEKYRTEKLSEGNPNAMIESASEMDETSAGNTIPSTMPGVTQPPIYKEQQQHRQHMDIQYHQEFQEQWADIRRQEAELKAKIQMLNEEGNKMGSMNENVQVGTIVAA